MRKIPTLFVRDEADRSRVTADVTPGCEWVLRGEGIATRKFDGTCVRIRRDGLHGHGLARRLVKPGKTPPAGYIAVETDQVTGITVGWEPVGQSPFARQFDEAIDELGGFSELLPGTYELCGPKINGNPERIEGAHRLLPHGLEIHGAPTDPDAIREFVATLGRDGVEGIVWRHPDGRMAKLKARDLR